MEVTRDLPTPPLPLTTPMTRLTWLMSLVFSKKLWGCCREGQSTPQLEQSWVQFSLIAVSSPYGEVSYSLLYLFF